MLSHVDSARAKWRRISLARRHGSSAMSAQCPLYPRKRTQVGHRDMSAKCLKATYAAQQMSTRFRRYFEASVDPCRWLMIDGMVAGGRCLGGKQSSDHTRTDQETKNVDQDDICAVRCHCSEHRRHSIGRDQETKKSL